MEITESGGWRVSEIIHLVAVSGSVSNLRTGGNRSGSCGEDAGGVDTEVSEGRTV
jgi:hypothetical protein